jgi:uncharacterized protein (TIGR03067 family)
MASLARQCYIVAVLTLLVAGHQTASWAAPVPKEKGKADAELILGTWELVTREAAPRGQTNGIHRELHREGKAIIIHTSTNRRIDAIYKIDPTKSPKEWDWKLGESGAEFLGIYELDGDTLKLAIVSKGTPRPTKMEATPGVSLSTYKRLPPK